MKKRRYRTKEGGKRRIIRDGVAQADIPTWRTQHKGRDRVQ
jgi:hypothetical protein